jgi:hypothetical protein
VLPHETTVQTVTMWNGSRSWKTIGKSREVAQVRPAPDYSTIALRAAAGMMAPTQWNHRVAPAVCSKRKEMMLRTSFVALAAAMALFAGSAAVADPLGNGTKEEQQACAPETVKFCKHELDVDASDTAAILKCLQRNRQKISTRCQVVLENHGK